MDRKNFYTPIISDELRNSLASVTAVTDQLQSVFQTVYSPIMSSVMEPIELVQKSVFQTIDMSPYKGFFTSAMEQLQIQSPAVEAIQSAWSAYADAFSGYEQLFQSISAFSDNTMEVMLEGTDFSKEEVIEDIEEFQQEMSVVSVDDTQKILPEEKVKSFLQNHPALAHILYIMNIILLVMSGIMTVDDFVVPMAQKAIVTLQGNDKIFFVKVDAAKLYSDSSSHSEVLTNVLYGEKVTLLESINMWDKVIYVDVDGNEIEGWIAKRNLMLYEDYQFNSDELYEE